MTDGSNPRSGGPSSRSTRPPSRAVRARRLLHRYMEDRGMSFQHIARELQTSTEEVERGLHGGDSVSLEWVEQVLAVLEVAPGEFFGRLYSDDPVELEGGGAPTDPEPPPPSEPETTPLGPETEDEVLTRDEVEGLVAEARSLIRGATRMIEAREHVDRESEADDD